MGAPSCKASKEPAASALTETPRVDGPAADHFGIQEHPNITRPAESLPTEPVDWGDGLIDLVAKPGWELERAKALLRTGATMPQIEQHLVAKGLSAEVARAAAEWAVEERVREPFDLLARAKRACRVDQILFTATACVIVGLAGWFFGTGAASRMAIKMLVFLAFIWFGQWAALLQRVDTLQTRIAILRWGGWILLLYHVLRAFCTEADHVGHN
jgi:hypothetical protein